MAGKVYLFMQKAAFSGEPVLLPELLDVDQAPLARAEGEVLQAADGQVVFVNTLWIRRRLLVWLNRQTYLQAVTPGSGCEPSLGTEKSAAS